jgi:hypothetical protein
MIVQPLQDEQVQKVLEKKIETLTIPSRQLISFCLEMDERIFVGYLLFSEDIEYQNRLSDQFRA